jgi:hypothetical protein
MHPLFHKVVYTLAVAMICQLASAQTPPGFTPAVTQKLNVQFGSTSISPGVVLDKACTPPSPITFLTLNERDFQMASTRQGM